MPLRSTLVILALISLFAVGGGGYFVNSRLSDTAWNVAREHANKTAEVIRDEVSFYFAHNRGAAITLAALPQIESLFEHNKRFSRDEINILLRNYCVNQSASLCYVMNPRGETLVASNFDSDRSVIGKNYSFRPYFRHAMQNKPYIYLALGVTTRKRGFYFSAPVKDADGKVTGVAVVKYPVEELEREYAALSGIFALIDPNGVVFASNRPQWLYQSLFELTSDAALSLLKSRQFGGISPSSAGLEKTSEGLLKSPDGTSYLFGAPALRQPEGWHVYYLADAANVSQLITSQVSGVPLKLLFSMLFLLIGAIVIFLYRHATNELLRRKNVENNLRLSEEKYRLLFEKSEDPMWVIYDNLFMLANHAAAQALGYESEHELRNIHPSKLSPEFQSDGTSSFELANRMMSLAYDNGYHRFEWDHLRRNGEVFPVEVSLTRIPYENDQALFCVWRDISESRQARHALETAKIEAENANRAKSEFLSTMSHEIRTPMTGIMGFADMLLDDKLPPKSDDKVQRIKGATRSLLRLLNDILDMSKLEAGKMEIEHIDMDLKALIDEVLALFSRSRQNDKPVELILDMDENLPQFIRSDPTRLRQVLVNLLGNALKFTHRGQVRLYGCLIDVQGKSMIKLGVEDSGIGISAQAMQTLFGQFTQADASISRRYEGSGLGLAISKRLVELLGGKLMAQSREGKGSNFWFTLPCVEGKKSATEQATSDDNSVTFRGIRSLNVLVAEDNRVNQMIIRRFMESYGHRVTLAENGEIAVERVAEDSFDLILMDVRMPVMDGVEATRRIRNMAGDISSTPIIAVTADAMKELREALVESGMNAYISKPFDRMELAQTINRVMGETIHVAENANAEVSPPHTGQPD